MSMITVRNERRPWRIAIRQITAYSCAAASSVDALVDVLGWSQLTALRAQNLLIDRLKLRRNGTALELVANEVNAHWGRHAIAEVRSLPLATSVAHAACGVGVVIGLAPHRRGAALGHAVRIEGGEGVLERVSSAPAAIRNRMSRGEEALADRIGFDVFVFDPARGRLTMSIAALREQFEREGSPVLLLRRRGTPLPRSWYLARSGR